MTPSRWFAREQNKPLVTFRNEALARPTRSSSPSPASHEAGPHFRYDFVDRKGRKHAGRILLWPAVCSSTEYCHGLARTATTSGPPATGPAIRHHQLEDGGDR